jgi:hypothetical protein
MAEFVVGNIFVRAMGEQAQAVQPGETIPGHKHNFDHTSIFFNGRWRAKKFSPSGDLIVDIERKGPFFLLIEAGCKHEFTYLADNTELGVAWCVYSHRTPQGEVSQVETGWLAAYDMKG